MIVESNLRFFCNNCSKGKVRLRCEHRGSSPYCVAYVECEYMPYCSSAVQNYEKAREEEERTLKTL